MSARISSRCPSPPPCGPQAHDETARAAVNSPTCSVTKPPASPGTSWRWWRLRSRISRWNSCGRGTVSRPNGLTRVSCATVLPSYCCRAAVLPCCRRAVLSVWPASASTSNSPAPQAFTGVFRHGPKERPPLHLWRTWQIVALRSVFCLCLLLPFAEFRVPGCVPTVPAWKPLSRWLSAAPARYPGKLEKLKVARL